MTKMTETDVPDLSAPTSIPSPPVPVVALSGVTRAFGGVRALDGLDLVVPLNSITVLLGPNGAGKTTAVRMITGALDPHAGSVRVFGLDPSADGETVRRRCGVVSAKPALYDRLTGFDNLVYAAELYGLGRHSEDRIRECAARFGIEDALGQMVGGYSTGMKTRLALSRSVLHDPDLLLFDEPTSGLDPESSHAVLDLIRQMQRDGSTVVMCTHLLLEAEGLAEQVVILEGGRNLISGSPGELTRRYWPHVVVRLDAEEPHTLDTLADHPDVIRYRRGEPVEIEITSLDALPDIVAALVAAGVRLTRVDPHDPSLEDLYFAVRSDTRTLAP
jgi:ABC-2 type transport system ATP-binding protein